MKRKLNLENKKFLYIFMEEFKSYFVSPIAYIVISIFLVVTGWFFFSTFFIYNQTYLRDFFSLLPIIFTFIIPAITMKLFSEEKNIGSYEILLTLPVSFIDVILGKLLAAISFVIIMLLPTLSYAICISFLGKLDWGPVIGGFIGAIFLGGAYSAIGIFTSSLTKNQIIAFILSLAICFILTFIDRILFFIPQSLIGFFNYLASGYHFQNISKGIIDFRDILYFVSIGFIACYGINLTMQETIIIVQKSNKITQIQRMPDY